jgi:outer membrane receptor protein involved in Fe transport
MDRVLMLALCLKVQRSLWVYLAAGVCGGIGLIVSDRAIAQVNLQDFPQAKTQAQHLSQTLPPLEATPEAIPVESPRDAEDEEEITVTAQKREQQAKEVPVTLSNFDEKTIQDYQINSVPDLAAKVPNFTIAPSSSGRIFTYYGLRGLNNANFLLITPTWPHGKFSRF